MQFGIVKMRRNAFSLKALISKIIEKALTHVFFIDDKII